MTEKVVVEGIMSVVMKPEHASVYQDWLKSQGLHLVAIPETDTYAVVIDAERYAHTAGRTAIRPDALAPYTAEQVVTLNTFQQGGWFHPFTCGRRNEHPDNEGVLVAREDGWHCPQAGCEYTQHWAHGFMADKEWVEARQQQHRDRQALWFVAEEPSGHA